MGCRMEDEEGSDLTNYDTSGTDALKRSSSIYLTP